MTQNKARNTKFIWLIAIFLLLLGSLPILTGSMQLITINAGLSGAEVPADSVHYVNAPIPIVVHIITGIIFSILGPFQLTSSLGNRKMKYHRIAGSIFVISGLITAITALWLNQYLPPVGGTSKYLSNVFFGIGLIVSLLLALRAILHRNVMIHRAWMIRAYAIGLGVATQRLLLIPWFLIYGIPEGETLGLLIWICWLINLGVAEWAIQLLSKRVRNKNKPGAPVPNVIT